MRRRKPVLILVSVSVLALVLGSMRDQEKVAAQGNIRAAQNGVTKYVRFQLGDNVAYGIVEGEEVVELDGDLFGEWSATDTRRPLASVKLLYPSARPTKILACAGNYVSHLGGARDPSPYPEMFLKPPSSLQHPGEPIVIPEMSPYLDYEAELVIVIGKRAKNVSRAEAMDYVLGITCGNDISARDWQRNDVQWWRAKGCDTFAPCGPYIVSGINYDDLLLTLRLKGEIKQQQRTSDLIHGVASVVSFVSRHMTLEPGDLIYTGTPGATSAIRPGDIVEVELEGVGVLRNPVVAAGR